MHRLIGELELDQWIRLEETQSTNDYLMNSALPAGTIVTARKQSRGRGRSGRIWRQSPQQGLYFSGLFGWEERPPGTTFSLAMALGLLDALQSSFPDGVASLALKWPNDLVRLKGQLQTGSRVTMRKSPANPEIQESDADSKIASNARTGSQLEKLGGILIEGKSAPGMWQTVVGIGLNWSGAPNEESGDAYPPGFLFSNETAEKPGQQPEDLVPALCAALNQRAQHYEQSSIIEDFQKWDVLQNRRIRIDNEARLVTGLDREGALVLEDGHRISDSARNLEILWS